MQSGVCRRKHSPLAPTCRANSNSSLGGAVAPSKQNASCRLPRRPPCMERSVSRDPHYLLPSCL
ncbi:hypothetical protein B0H19DRAFT_438681 [Mycena capillaripes]|nr:hypothetical protein B0H19DRAFT_438681 [Mycena capillaripes]